VLNYRLSHWGTCISLTILDLLLQPLENYKVQQDKIARLSFGQMINSILKAAWQNLWMQVILILPLLLIDYAAGLIFRDGKTSLTLVRPSKFVMAKQFFAFVFAYEITLYFLHWFVLHKNAWWFKKVHSHHHKIRFPFVFDALVMHYGELYMDAVCFLLFLFLVFLWECLGTKYHLPGHHKAVLLGPYRIYRMDNMFQFGLYHIRASCIADVLLQVLHSGFEIFPNWTIFYPIRELTKQHDAHHKYIMGNFSTFWILDRIFKTRCSDYNINIKDD